MKVLVVEDDLSMCNAIAEALTQEGYEVTLANNGNDGEWFARQDIYDLILLDIMLPGQDGLSLTQHVREQGLDTPILLVTARDAILDRVAGLDVGADDYLVKPFALTELLARVRALLRRRQPGAYTAGLEYKGLSLNPKTRTAQFHNQILTLTSKEYDLLEFFLSNPKRILTREQIFERVWGFDSEAGDTVVDVYVHYLRRKLTAAGCDEAIRTQRGVGFILD
ncbi:DNA-binding response regulator [Alicyclobacillaceae bacterium I2511]|nr:DNA-binding response regulator [Alicyclobacillaceae bacterium I2511]